MQYVLGSVHQQIENLQIATVDDPTQAGKLAKLTEGVQALKVAIDQGKQLVYAKVLHHRLAHQHQDGYSFAASVYQHALGNTPYVNNHDVLLSGVLALPYYRFAQLTPVEQQKAEAAMKRDNPVKRPALLAKRKPGAANNPGGRTKKGRK